MRSAKTQISLRIRAVWSESSLIACTFYSRRAIQGGINENLCYTGWRYRLIWAFAGHTGLIVGLWCAGSNDVFLYRVCWICFCWPFQRGSFVAIHFCLFVCLLLQLCPYILSLFVPQLMLPSVAREHCASWLWLFLRNLINIFATAHIAFIMIRPKVRLSTNLDHCQLT